MLVFFRDWIKNKPLIKASCCMFLGFSIFSLVDSIKPPIVAEFHNFFQASLESDSNIEHATQPLCFIDATCEDSEKMPSDQEETDDQETESTLPKSVFEYVFLKNHKIVKLPDLLVSDSPSFSFIFNYDFKLVNQIIRPPRS